MKTDLEIQHDVIDELKWVPLLHASEIGVAVKNGIVTLTGTVDTYTKKYSAENAAKKVSGVKAVAEEIEVKISSLGKRNDTEIAEAVLNALKWHSSVPHDKLKVKVEDGMVTLDGEVEWEYQKTSARNSVINLLGVRGINNFIKVTPKIIVTLTEDKVRSNIIKALHRRAARDAEKIHIETEGNKITLSGTVHTSAEKYDAANAAWSIPGVVWVENHIDIEADVYAY